MIDIQKERTACELSMADGDMERHKFLQKIFTFNEEVSGGKERYNNHQKSYWAGWLAAKSQATPDGFVLVPKEPTEEMLGAAWEAPPVGGASGNRRSFYEKQTVVYKAMIEAAEGE